MDDHRVTYGDLKHFVDLVDNGGPWWTMVGLGLVLLLFGSGLVLGVGTGHHRSPSYCFTVQPFAEAQPDTLPAADEAGPWHLR